MPGVVFGNNGESHLRVSFASSEENIAEGLKRIKKGARRNYKRVRPGSGELTLGRSRDAEA